MPQAFYIRVAAPMKDILSDVDRIGGLPSHLPPNLPCSRVTGLELCFLLQITSLELVGLKGWRSIQLYQSGEVDDGDDPTPVAVLVPLDAPRNDKGNGRVQPFLDTAEIRLEESQDPDVFPVESGLSDDVLRLVGSKLGGLPPAHLDPPPNARYLGQISEGLGFSFGGLLTMWLTNDGRLECMLI
jgi:hypothetical protein